MTVTNLAFYRFARVEDPDALVERVAQACAERDLLGKIVVAHEGINGMVAGSGDDCDAFEAWMREDSRFERMRFKRSLSAAAPFAKLVVRHKPEIVTMRLDGVDAIAHTARHVSPTVLRDWIRSGAPLTLVDVRNAYEVGIGTFRGALNPRTEYFHQFPEWAAAHRDELASARVVTFCTGGIRCEKATSWMLEELGLVDVYQLEGGILAYFEEVDDPEQDWEGELFVFDGRVALDTNLEETSTELCAICGDPDTACGCPR